MKKILGIIFIAAGAISLPKCITPSILGTIGGLIGVSLVCFLPAYFLLKGKKKQNYSETKTEQQDERNLNSNKSKETEHQQDVSQQADVLPAKILREAETAFEWFKQGNLKYNRGIYREAINDYTKAIEIVPNYTEAYFHRGNARCQISDQDNAIVDYSKVIELDPESKTPYIPRGFENSEAGVTIINPRFGWAYNARGNAKYELEDYKEAIEDYNKVITINPEFAWAYSRRGTAKYELEDYKGAIEDFTKAIAANPEVGYLGYIFRGHAKFHLGDYNGAIEDFTKEIEADPELGCYNERGDVKYMLNDFKGAIEDYSMAIKNLSGDSTAYVGIGNIKHKLKDNNKAIANYTKAIEIDPMNSLAYFYRGTVKNEIKDYTNAIIDYTDAIKIIEDIASYDDRGPVKNYAKSILSMAKHNPEYAKSYYNRGLSKIEIGQKDTGLLDLSKAGELGYSGAYEMIKKHCN